MELLLKKKNSSKLKSNQKGEKKVLTYAGFNFREKDNKLHWTNRNI